MDLIAHRGFAERGPENALETLRRATEVAEAVEFDVRLAGDDEPVVFHDSTVDRLTDASGPVAAYTAAELSALPVAGTEATIPTLAAALDALDGPIVADLKTDRVPDRLPGLLRAYGSPVLVSSFDPGILRGLPNDLASALLCAPGAFQADVPDGAPDGAEAAVNLATDLGAAAIHPHYSLCSSAVVEEAHSAGLRVNAWTVRSRDVGARMESVGVDGAIADSPDYVDG